MTLVRCVAGALSPAIVVSHYSPEMDQLVLTSPQVARAISDTVAQPSNMSGGGQVMPSSSDEVQGTTLFVSDAGGNVQQARHQMLDEALSLERMDSNSIGLFMSKPIPVRQFIFSSTAGMNSGLASLSIADEMFAAPMWKNKLSGYNLFRGTAVVRLVVNSQPFQAGRLLLHFLPCYKQFDSYSATYGNHNLNLTTKTQQPNVELDIQDSYCELEIPYVAPTTWYSRQTPFDWGAVFVTVLSPLSSSGATNIDCTLFLSFKDFECAAPIYGPEMDVALTAFQAVERTVKQRKLISGGLASLSSLADKGASASLSIVEKNENPLMKAVGVLGLIGSKAASWATSAGSFVAKLFGYSRPQVPLTATPFFSHALANSFTFLGENHSDPLSIDPVATLPALKNFAGSEVDEMSFGYLKTIPAYCASFLLSTSDATDQSVYSWNASPMNACDTVTRTHAPGQLVYATGCPMYHLSQYFLYYRGGVRVTFKIVKTPYHSGRYAVEFTPSTSNVPANNVQGSYVYRDIIDIKESSIYSFDLPYMHPAPWLRTRNDDNLNEETAFGVLTVRCLNPLVAAPTVSSSVVVLVYFSALDDFALAGTQPVGPVTLQVQSDIPRISKSIGGAPVQDATLLPYQASAPEFFVSLKQLLNCLRPVVNSGVSSTGLIGATGAALYPYVMSIGTETDLTTPAAVNLGHLSCDYISELGSAFAFSRGGLRYVFTSTAPSSAQLSVIIPNDATEPLVKPSYSYDFSQTTVLNSATPLTFPATTGPVAWRSGAPMDVLVPHAGQTPMRLNYISTTNGSNTSVLGSDYIPTTLDSPDFLLNFRVSDDASETVPRRLFRSGADDFVLGFFIGFLPIVRVVSAT